MAEDSKTRFLNRRGNAANKKNNTTTEQRQSKKAIGTPAIEAIRRMVDRVKPFELSTSQRHATYQTMLLDDSVFSSFDDRAVAIERAQANGKFRYKKDSPESKRIKEFLEYNMATLVGQTTRSIGRSCAEMIAHGWAPHEVSYQKIEDGEYPDLWTLRKLVYIHPLSLQQSQPWDVASGGRSISNLRQTSEAYRGSGDNATLNSAVLWKGIRKIDYRRVAVAAYCATESQPNGISPLDAAFVPWKEKQLLQDYMLIGVTRDFAGTPVLRIPSEILEAAENDPNSPEAQQLAALTQGMQLMHSGDATYIILPSDGQSETGVGTLRDYDIDFKGVDGGGKNFNITEIIEQKKKAIHNVLSTRHLISGENGGSSYNLHEGQAGGAALVADRDNMIIDEMWNKVIFPKLMRLNKWEYKAADMPRWEHGEVQPISYDEKGKYLQRTMRILPAIPEVVNDILDDLNIDARIPDNATPDDIREMMFDFKEESKVGTSEGTSGQGGDKQDNSDNNSDNAA